MIPIPKEMLIHSCVLEKYSEGTDGTEVISSQTLRNVRIMPQNIRTAGVTDGTKGGGVLIFDCVYSTPEDTEFISDGYRSRIRHGGKIYAITAVKFIYDDERLHHIEAELS